MLLKMKLLKRMEFSTDTNELDDKIDKVEKNRFLM